MKIEYENVRDFRKLELDLTSSKRSPYGISLIQMPNGTGKTTTMDLLRGSFRGRHSIDLYDLQPDIENNGYTASEGFFKITFTFNNVYYVIKSTFDYDEGKIKFTTSKDRGGSETGHHLPVQIDPMMTGATSGFADLFILDGEKSSQFFKEGETDAEDSIKSLYHLDKLRSLRDQIDKIAEKKRKKSTKTKTTTAKGLGGVDTKISNLKNQRTVLLRQKNDCEKTISQLQKIYDQKKEKRDKLVDSIGELKEDYAKAEKDLETNDKEIKQNANQIIQNLRKMGRFSKAMNDRF